jgi:hypothetical protein
MNFTYQTVTTDDTGIPLPPDMCHIRYETEDGVHSQIIAIPHEVFAGLASQADKVTFVENQLKEIVLAKVTASSLVFSGSAVVEVDAVAESFSGSSTTETQPST